VLLQKTDYHAEGKGEFYETHLEQKGDEYHLYQSHGGYGHLSKDEESVVMNRDQAIEIAKTILRNEGLLDA